MSTALVMLAMTSVLVPRVVGLYSWSALALTLVLAASDVPARQIAVVATGTAEGARLSHLYTRWAALGGAVVMAATLLALAVGVSEARRDVALLAPMVLVPMTAAVNVAPVAQLQRAGAWRQLAFAGTTASLVSLLVAGTTLAATRSVAGAGIQALVAEVVMAVLLRRLSRRQPDLPSARASGTSDIAIIREFRSTAAGSVLAWLQGQGDRVVVGLVAGPAALAIYQFAWVVSRAGSDALATSSANVLRARLVDARHHGEARAVVTSVVGRSLLMAGVVWLLTSVVALTLLPLVVGDEWTGALAIVPVIGLSGVVATISWSCTSILMVAGRVRQALPSRIVGAVLCIPVGLAAARSLDVAAWAALAREAVTLALVARVVGSALPGKVMLWAAAVVTGGASLCIILQIEGAFSG